MRAGHREREQSEFLMCFLMRWTWLSCNILFLYVDEAKLHFFPRKRFIDDVNEMKHVCRMFELCERCNDVLIQIWCRNTGKLIRSEFGLLLAADNEKQRLRNFYWCTNSHLFEKYYFDARVYYAIEHLYNGILL